MNTIVIRGREYALGCLERKAPVGRVRPCIETAIPLVRQADWKPVDFSRHLPSIVLQASHGSCVGHQCTDAVMGGRVATGLPPGDLSPWDLYRRIAGGSDNGASISDALEALHQVGVCDLKLCPSFTLSTRKPDGYDANAGLHKVEESFDCPNRASIATALQDGLFTPLGVVVCGNFENLEEIDGKPCIPRPAGGERGGHCVVGCGLDLIGGKWRVKLATKSWGDDFGDNGCAWYCLDWIDDNYADAWAIRSVTFSRE